jgi:hypothetical protein
MSPSFLRTLPLPITAMRSPASAHQSCGMISVMSDELIHDRIEVLVAEEKTLEAKERQDADDDGALSTDRERLEAVRVELDRAWDLLRQRRGLREAGQDAGDAAPRDAGTVEGYLQ